jgi:hypothetical protein
MIWGWLLILDRTLIERMTQLFRDQNPELNHRGHRSVKICVISASPSICWGGRAFLQVQKLGRGSVFGQIQNPRVKVVI